MLKRIKKLLKNSKKATIKAYSLT
ncbi:type II secretion system protein, partial [Flavobacterium circumlabens]